MKRVPIRGGNWNNSALAGVFALNLNNARSNSNTIIGARPALGDCQKPLAYWADGQSALKRMRQPRLQRINMTAAAEILNRTAIPVRRKPQRLARSLFVKGNAVKTYGGLFERVYAFDALHAAYRRARLGKRDQAEVQKFEQDLEGNLIQLQNELIWGTYQTGRYRTFIVNEPKERLVAALPFRDRVVQHALVAVIEPIWEARFIADNYACRPGRGTHRGADRAEAMLRKVKREHGKVCVLKGDVAKYFPSIDHEILRGLFARRIRCRRTMALLNDIIDSSNQVNERFGVGVPIGNLVSQLAANVYLHELDLFAKHDLRERHYIRYMDDFVVVHHDKEHLHRVLARIESFLADRLRLSTNRKTQVFPVGIVRGRALDFLGYQIWPTHRRLRRDSITRIGGSLRALRRYYAQGRVSLARVSQSVQSWCNHASHANTYRLRAAVLDRFAFVRNPSAPQIHAPIQE